MVTKRYDTRLTSEEISQRIREARLARGWTHEELARRMDVNWRTVQRWQSGSLPRLPTLVRLADVLGVPHSHFVAQDDSIATLEELRQQLAELTERVDALTAAVAALAAPDVNEVRSASSA